MPTATTRARRLLALISLLGAVFLVSLYVKRSRSDARSSTPPPNPSSGGVSQAIVDGLIALEAKEREMDETVWAPELLAQRCGAVVDGIWDALNRATNKLEALGRVTLGQLSIGQTTRAIELPQRIQIETLGPETSPWEIALWQAALKEAAAVGWELRRVEFRQQAFEGQGADGPGESRYYGLAHLENKSLVQRLMIEGHFTVVWAVPETPLRPPQIQSIRADQLTRRLQSGTSPFRREFLTTIAPPQGSFFIGPLMLRDLDGDHLPEIILAAKNLVYRREADGTYLSGPLCREDPGLIFTAVIGDFTGDDVDDFLCARFEGLRLFSGSAAGGTFEKPGVSAWDVEPHLKYGQVLTSGDVDGDGDLDVWLGQYKTPYHGGQMPTPYYDANDGHPSYLLLNDGHGRFSDATRGAGLETKRWRRTYSASLVDLDLDGALDLVVVSDFAGVDLYRNDGHGRFADVTSWLSERHGFGMAHTLADFDLDGRLDLLVTGMRCPAALRLSHLGLVRPGFEAYAAMTARMTSGNLLHLRTDKGFTQAPGAQSIAQSGWSWGCVSLDWNNDGYPDVYIPNGHETRALVKDYEPQFWMHDIYVADSDEDELMNVYFGSKFARTRGQGESYGGHEVNRLFMNQEGKRFHEIGFLAGVDVTEDSRVAAAGDLDGDGRMDLVVTTFETWPRPRQTLRVLRNRLEDGGHWIGFHLGRHSPVGTRVELHWGTNVTTRSLVTGDSHRAQQPTTLHFGLGPTERVDRAEVYWPDGRMATRGDLQGDRYYHLQPSE